MRKFEAEKISYLSGRSSVKQRNLVCLTVFFTALCFLHAVFFLFSFCEPAGVEFSRFIFDTFPSSFDQGVFRAGCPSAPLTTAMTRSLLHRSTFIMTYSASSLEISSSSLDKVSEKGDLSTLSINETRSWASDFSTFSNSLGLDLDQHVSIPLSSFLHLAQDLFRLE